MTATTNMRFTTVVATGNSKYRELFIFVNVNGMYCTVERSKEAIDAIGRMDIVSQSNNKATARCSLTN